VTASYELRGETARSTAPLWLTVFGANGGSGRALLRQALDAGHQVTAITRHPEQIPHREDGLTVLRGDATDAADVRTAVEGADAVLSTLGVPYSRDPISLYSASARQIVDAMRQVGARRLIVVTSSAVDPEVRPNGVLGPLVIGPLIHRLGRTMYADMRRMEAIVQDSGLDWTILRPPALFDKQAPGPTELSVEPTAGQFAARQDLAAAMLTEARSTAHLQKVLYISSLEGRPSIWRTIWQDAIRKKH
jgi:uncharacterized protein YbjT (DUF2867 family)